MRNLEIMDKQFLKQNLTYFKRGQTVNKNIQIVKEINKKQEIKVLDNNNSKQCNYNLLKKK